MVEEILETSKEWSLRRRILWHAFLHQLAIMEWHNDPSHPMLKEYLTFTYDAITGFLWGEQNQECLTEVKMADEAFKALYDALGKSLDKDFRENPFECESDSSLLCVLT